MNPCEGKPLVGTLGVQLPPERHTVLGFVMHASEAAIAQIASVQHGLVTRAQLSERGIGPSFARRRVAGGHWVAKAPGVFAVRGAPNTFRQRILAAQLGAGAGAIVSHRTALYLWGIRVGGSVPIEITIPRPRSHRRAGVIVHQSRDLELADSRLLDGITVAGLGRSLLDLGAVEPHRVRKAVWAARRDRGLAWNSLLDVLVRHSRRGRNGIGPLRRLVAAHYGDLATDSATEDVAYGILFDANAVPTPDKQVPAQCADGAWVTADFGWPRYRALLEIEGVDHLTNEDVQHMDRHRRNQLELAGYRVLTYTGKLVRERPDQFVNDVRTLLELAGWSVNPNCR